MDTRFTKSEWIAGEGVSMARSHLITTQHQSAENNIAPIFVTETDFDGVVDERQKANAHLISAAPDMYKALSNIIHEYDICSSNSISIDAEEIRSALKKARGE